MTRLGKKNPATVIAYSTARAKDWAENTRNNIIYGLIRFHRWLDSNGLDISDLTPIQLQKYIERPGRQSTSLLYQKTHLLQIRAYLFWLYTDGKITLDPNIFRPKCTLRGQLHIPEVVSDFCTAKATTWRRATLENARYIAGAFYRWLATSSLRGNDD